MGKNNESRNSVYFSIAPNFTKIADYYTRWSPMVRDNHWVFKNRFAPGTINPYGYVQHKHKPVSEPEEPAPEPEPEPQPEPQPEHELTVLEQPDWKVGDWWIVKVRQPSVRAEPCLLYTSDAADE